MSFRSHVISYGLTRWPHNWRRNIRVSSLSLYPSYNPFHYCSNHSLSHVSSFSSSSSSSIRPTHIQEALNRYDELESKHPSFQPASSLSETIPWVLHSSWNQEMQLLRTTFLQHSMYDEALQVQFQILQVQFHSLKLELEKQKLHLEMKFKFNRNRELEHSVLLIQFLSQIPSCTFLFDMIPKPQPHSQSSQNVSPVETQCREIAQSFHWIGTLALQQYSHSSGTQNDPNNKKENLLPNEKQKNQNNVKENLLSISQAYLFLSLQWKQTVSPSRQYHCDIGKTWNALAIVQIQKEQENEKEQDDEKEDEIQKDKKIHELLETWLSSHTLPLEINWNWNGNHTLSRRALFYLEEANRHYRYHGKMIQDSPPEEEEEKDEKMTYSLTHDHTHSLTYHQVQEWISILENIAMIYRTQDQFSIALTKYQEMLHVQQQVQSLLPSSEKSLERNDTEWNSKIAMILLDIADCFLALDKYEEAQEHYSRALQFYSTQEDEEKEAKEKEEDFLKSKDAKDIVLYEQQNTNTYTNTHTHTNRKYAAMESIIRLNLGKIHAHQGKHDLAMEEYQQSLQIQKDLLGMDECHPQIAIRMNACGASLASMGEYETALSYFRGALRIYEMLAMETQDLEFLEKIDSIQKNIQMVHSHNKGNF